MNEIDSVELVKADPKLMALKKRVMDQHGAILRMNGRLLDMMTSPLLLLRRKDTANDQAHFRACSEAEGS